MTIMYSQCETCGGLAKKQGEHVKKFARFCSDACRWKRYRPKAVGRDHLRRKLSTCWNCKKSFRPKRVDATTFCSRDCSYAWIATHSPKGFMKTAPLNWAKQSKRRRRAARKGQQPFKPIEIFERDGWCCQICGKMVDKNAKFPQPRTPTLDHITPIIAGGVHSRENVQCAHLSCNVRRREVGYAQARLFG